MHRRSSWWDRLSPNARRRLPAILALAVAFVVAGGSLGYAAGVTSTNTAVACPADADLNVHPDGTWSCGAAPSPSGSASPSPTSSPSPSPSTSPTTSPSPSPTSPSPSPSTSTTAPAKGCWADPGACGYPTPATTGVPAGTVLTAYTGPTSIRSATVIDGKTLGCLDISGGSVVIRNSRITCSQGVAVEVQGSANLVIEDTEISCVTGSGTGIDRSPSGSFAARRLYVHDCENGLHMESNTSVTDSYISVRTITQAAHSDGIQGVSGSNIVIRHNTIHNPDIGGTSSIIFAGQNMPSLVVDGNLLSGGTYTVYCPSAGNAVYSNNRFAGPVAYRVPGLGPDYGYSDGCARSGITWTGNVRDDTGAAISAA